MAGLGQLFYKAGVEVDLSNLEKLEQRLAKLKTVYNIELRVSDVTALNYLERCILKTSEAATRLSKITKDVSDEIGDNFARASKKAADAANDIGVAIHQSTKHSDIKSATKELEQLTNGFSKYYTIVADIQAALSKGSNGNEFARNFKRSLGDIEATIRRYEALANAISTVHGVARDQGAIKGRQGNVLLKEAEQARTLANALAEIRDSFTKLGPNATGDEMFKSVSSTIKRVFGKDFEDALGSSFKKMQKVESKANVLFYNLGNNLKNATIGPAVEAYRKELYRSFEGFNLAGLKINSIMIEKFVPAKNSIKELWDNINNYFRQNPIEVAVSGGKKAKKTNSDDAYATHVGRPTADEENERQNKYDRLKDAVNGMIGALNDSNTISDQTKRTEFFTDAITKGNFLGIARANIDSFFKNEKEAKDFYSKFDDPKTSVFDKIQMLIDSLKQINPTYKAPSLGESAPKQNNAESAAAIAKAVQKAYSSKIDSTAGSGSRLDSYAKSTFNANEDVNNTFVRKTKEYTDAIDSAISSINKIISSTKNAGVSNEFNLLKRDLEDAKKKLESTVNKVFKYDATPDDARTAAASVEGLLMRFQKMASATKNGDYEKVAKSYETLLALQEKLPSYGSADKKLQEDISTQLRLQKEFNNTGTITDSLSSSVRVLGDALNQVSGQVSNAVQGVRQISTSPSAAAPDASRVLNSAISQEELEKRFNVVSAAVTTFSNDFSKMYAGGNKPSDDELKRFLTSVKSGAFGEGYKNEADKLLSMFSRINDPLTGGMARGSIERDSKALYDKILNSLVKQFESYKNMMNSDAARTIAEKERLRKIEEPDRIKEKNDRIIESLSKKQIDIEDKLNVMKSMGIDGPAMRKAEQELNALLSRISEAVSKRDTTSAKALLGGDIAKSMAEVRKNVELQRGAFKEEYAQIDAICNAIKKLKKEYDSLDVAMYKLSNKGLDTSILSAKRDEISAKINEMRGSLTDSTLRASMAKTAKDTADALIVSSRKVIIDQSSINRAAASANPGGIVADADNSKKNYEKLLDVINKVNDSLRVMKERRSIGLANDKDVYELDEAIRRYERYLQLLEIARKSGNQTIQSAMVGASKRSIDVLGNQKTIALMRDKDATADFASGIKASETIKRMRDALEYQKTKLNNTVVKGTNIKVDNTEAVRKIDELLARLAYLDSLSGKKRKVELQSAIRSGEFSLGTKQITDLSREAYDRAKAGAGSGANSASKEVNDLNSRMNETSRITQELGGLISQAFSIYTVQNFLHELVQVGGEMQKQHLALKSILGDVNRADTLFSDLKNQAINSPFKFSQLSSYAKQLSAYSIPYEELAETTKRLSDVSAGLGVDMSRIILAYGQIRSAAFLRGQELRQLTEAGIPMLDKLAEKFTMLEGRAVSTAEVFKKISSREVSFDMVKDVFWDLTNEGGQFYKMQENLMESVSGKMAKLRDQYEIALGNIADSNNKLIGGIIDSFIWFASHTEAFVKGVGMATAAWLAFKTAVFVGGGLQWMSLSAKYKTMTAAIEHFSKSTTETATVSQVAAMKMSKAWKSFTDSLKTLSWGGWVGIILGVAAAIVSYFYLVESEAEKLNKKLEEIKNETSEMSRTAKNGIDEVVASLKQATEGTSEWSDIIKTINSRYGQYLDNLLTEADGYDKVAEAAERAKDAITAKFAEERYQRSMSAIDETYKETKDEAYRRIGVLGEHMKLESQAGDDVSIAKSVKKAIAKDVFDYAIELVDFDDFEDTGNDDELLRKLFDEKIPFAFFADKYNLKELSYDSFFNNATGTNSLVTSYRHAKDYIQKRQQALKELQEETEGYNPWAPEVKRITDKYNNEIDKSTNNDDKLRLKAGMYQTIIDEMLSRGATSNNKYVIEYKKKLEEIQSLRQGFVNVAREVLDGNKKFVVEFNGELKDETIGFPSLMPGNDDRTDFDAYLRRLAEVYKKNKETIEKLDKLKEDSSGKQDQFGNEVFGFASAKDLAKANLQKELLDELARRYGIKWEDYEKSSSKNKKGSNEKDTAAEKLQKELDLMKDIYSEYEKWTKGPNGLTKDQAIKKILDSEIIKFRADELGLKNSLGNIDFSNIDQYKAALSRLKDTAVRLVNESTKEEWKERRKDIYKNICKLLGLDIPYDELKREAEALALRTQRSIDEATKKWDFVKTLASSGKNAEKALAESFGDEEALKNISNGVYSLRQWLKAELKEKLSGILSNSDVPENISKNINALISDSDKKGGLRKYFSMTDDELTSMFGETTPLVKTFINALKSATENEIKEAQSAYVNALKETQTFLAKRNAIISEYNKNIAAEGLSKEAIDALTLNKDMKLSKLDFEEWKKNPYNSFVTTSLENSSAQMLEDTRKSLKTLIDKGRKKYDNATWTEMQELYNKILTQQETRKLLPNVFKSIAKRRVKSAEYDKKYEEVVVARASLYYAEEQLAMAADKEEKKIWKNTVDELYDLVSNLERELDDLEKEVKDSMQAVEYSIKSCISNFEKLGSSFKKLGDSIGGTVGKEISLAGDTFSAMSSMMSSAKNFEKGGIDSVTSAMEVLATSISITKTLVDSVQEYNERLYKKDADEKDLINSKIDLVNRYAAALIKTRQEEKNWFGTTSFIGVSDSLERSAQAANAYYDKLYESQAMYKNKQGKSYWRQITAGIVVAAGAALAAWTGGASAMGSMAAASALMAAAGAGYAAGAYAESGVEKMIDKIKYANGEVAAMYNLVIETQAAKNKLFKSRDQKTKDLQSWIYDNADAFRKAGIRDLELFNEEGLINKELAQAILDTEKWASKLQGQTEENLRELIELRDAVDEFQNSLREAVSNAYDPIVSNMTDAIWDWFDNGANALRSFRDLAADTFRGIATELMQTMLYDKIFSQFKDSIYGLYEEYFYSKSNPNIDFSEEKLTNDISQEVGKIYGQFEDSSEAMKEFLEIFEGQLNEEDLTMKKKSSSSALSSSISNIKEETADILVAYCNGMRADLSIVRYINEMVAYEQLPQISAIATAQLTQLNMQTEYLRIISENTASNLFIAEDLKADLHSIATGDAKLKIS